MLAPVRALLAPTVTPEQGIHRNNHITVLRKIVTKILTLIKIVGPLVGIIVHPSINLKRTYHLLLSYSVVSAMVMKSHQGWERAISVGSEHISLDTRIVSKIECHLLGCVTVALLLCHNLRSPRRGMLGRREHQLYHFIPCCPVPDTVVLDITVSPCQRIGQLLMYPVKKCGHVPLDLISGRVWHVRLFRLCRCSKSQCGNGEICNKSFHGTTIILLIYKISKIPGISQHITQKYGSEITSDPYLPKYTLYFDILTLFHQVLLFLTETITVGHA